MSSPFVDPAAGRPEARLRLFCQPYAGGGVAVYRDWPAAMPDGVEVIPVRLAGREARLREPAATAMTPLADAVWAGIAPLTDRPFAFFGHSMGAALSWELTRRAIAAGLPPVRLFVSARRAPGRPAPHPPMFALPEPTLVAEVERLYGPFPEALRARPALLRTFLPTLRADMQVIDTWQAPTDPVALPITVYGGAGDATVSQADLDAWHDRSTADVRVHLLPGTHFHVREHPACRDHVAATLREHLGA